jgi:hypothetical protein
LAVAVGSEEEGSWQLAVAVGSEEEGSWQLAVAVGSKEKHPTWNIEHRTSNNTESDSCLPAVDVSAKAGGSPARRSLGEGGCYSDAKRSWYSSGLKLTGVISQPQGLCTAANWVFICDRDLPTKGMGVRETDWSQVREIALPTDARGSLIGLVRYGHRPPEKRVEIDVGAALGH